MKRILCFFRFDVLGGRNLRVINTCLKVVVICLESNVSQLNGVLFEIIYRCMKLMRLFYIFNVLAGETKDNKGTSY